MRGGDPSPGLCKSGQEQGTQKGPSLLKYDWQDKRDLREEGSEFHFAFQVFRFSRPFRTKRMWEAVTAGAAQGHQDRQPRCLLPCLWLGCSARQVQPWDTGVSKLASLGCGCGSRARGRGSSMGHISFLTESSGQVKRGGHAEGSFRDGWIQSLQCPHRTLSLLPCYVLVPRLCSSWLPLPQAHSGHYCKCLRTSPDWTVWVTCPSLGQSLWSGLC